MRIIAGLKLNDDTPHIQKLQLCMALAKGVLDLKPGEQPECVLKGQAKYSVRKTQLERFVREDFSDAISKAELILKKIDERYKAKQTKPG